MTLGRSRLSYEPMESVVMDIERNLKNRPLTCVEAEGEEEVLTPNVITWGRDAHPIEDIELIEDDKEKLRKIIRDWKKLRPMHGNNGRENTSTV